MPLSPVAQRQHHRLQAEAESGRGIFHTRRNLPEHLPVDQPMSLEFAKLLDKHLLADGRDQPRQVGQPLRPIEQMVEDHRLPPARDRADGAFDRQDRQILDRLGHAYLLVCMGETSP